MSQTTVLLWYEIRLSVYVYAMDLPLQGDGAWQHGQDMKHSAQM